jgi:hypothetical protein
MPVPPVPILALPPHHCLLSHVPQLWSRWMGDSVSPPPGHMSLSCLHLTSFCLEFPSLPSLQGKLLLSLRHWTQRPLFWETCLSHLSHHPRHRGLPTSGAAATVSSFPLLGVRQLAGSPTGREMPVSSCLPSWASSQRRKSQRWASVWHRS